MTTASTPTITEEPQGKLHALLRARSGLRDYLHLPLTVALAVLAWVIAGPIVSAISVLFARWQSPSEVLTVGLFALCAALVAFAVSTGYAWATKWLLGRLRRASSAKPVNAHRVAFLCGALVSAVWVGVLLYSTQMLPSTYKSTTAGLLVLVLLGAHLGVHRFYRK